VAAPHPSENNSTVSSSFGGKLRNVSCHLVASNMAANKLQGNSLIRLWRNEEEREEEEEEEEEDARQPGVRCHPLIAGLVWPQGRLGVQ